MTAKVILNPYSNRWNAKARWPDADAALRDAGVDFDLSVSEHADHIVDLAADAVRKGFSTIIVAGGEGAIDEVVNGAGRDWDEKSPFPVTLGLIPLGTANDLFNNMNMTDDLVSVAKIIAGGKTKSIDLCKCNERYFVNTSGAGLEPYTTTKERKIKWISGIPRYLVAAIQGIMDNPTWGAKMEWDGGSYEGPVTLITVGNCARTGGVFYLTPHADQFDGKLTFVYGYRGTRLGLFSALPRTMKPGEGSYVEMEGIHEVECTHLKIHLDHPSPAHTDGELFDEWVTDLEYRIFPSALNILVP